MKDGREIDFILQHDGETVPVEVKGGEEVKSPSMKGYVKHRNPRVAVRFSERNFHVDGPLRSVPLYFAPRLMDAICAAFKP